MRPGTAWSAPIWSLPTPDIEGKTGLHIVRLLMMAALAACLLTGCGHTLTLEEARAECTRQGGFLMVIHTQKITRAGVGKEIDSPGDCVSASRFEEAAPVPGPAK